MSRFILILAAMLPLVGCGTVHAVMDTWVGAPVDELIVSWGAPDGESQLSDGRRVYTWNRVSTLDGNSYGCTQNFVANSNGIVVQTTSTGSSCGEYAAEGPARLEGTD